MIAQNKKASHDYFIKETLEAGIALTGTEIKSIRARRINLRDGYVQIINGSAFFRKMFILVNIKKVIAIIMILYDHGACCFIRKKLLV